LSYSATTRFDAKSHSCVSFKFQRNKNKVQSDKIKLQKHENLALNNLNAGKTGVNYNRDFNVFIHVLKGIETRALADYVLFDAVINNYQLSAN